jgi:hypothetical protein
MQLEMQRPSTPLSERQDFGMNLFCRLTKKVGTHLLLESQSASSARDDAATLSDVRTAFGTHTLSPAGHTSAGHALKELAMSVGSTGVQRPPSPPVEASGPPSPVFMPPVFAPPLAFAAPPLVGAPPPVPVTPLVPMPPLAADAPPLPGTPPPPGTPLIPEAPDVPAVFAPPPPVPVGEVADPPSSEQL